MALLTESPAEIGDVQISPPPDGDFNMLFLIDRLREKGGAELALMRLARDLPARGIKPIVLAFQETIAPDFHALFSCPLFAVPIVRTYDYTAWCAARQIRALIRAHNIRLVHTFFETSDLFGGFVTKTMPGVALISSRRDMGILRKPKHRAAYRALGRLPDRIVTVSDRVRDWCIGEDRVPPERVVTVYNGVDCAVANDSRPVDQHRYHTRKQLGIEEDQIVVTAVGNLRLVKGYDVLIEAAEIVVRSHPNAVFLIAGDEHEDRMSAQLQGMIRQKGLTATIHLLGAVKDTGALLRASDIFVLPSRSEGFSNALVEAMMARLPCVATDVGGNSEALLAGQSGFLVPTEDPPALADALGPLLCSPSLRASMGETGRRLALKRFTQSAMVDNMLKVYRGVLD